MELAPNPRHSGGS